MNQIELNLSLNFKLKNTFNIILIFRIKRISKFYFIYIKYELD